MQIEPVARKSRTSFILGKSTPSLEEIMNIINESDQVKSGLTKFSFDMRYLPEKGGWQITTIAIY